jgi:hypothetical protein
MKYPYYFHPEIKSYSELVEYDKIHPEANVFDYDNAEYELMLSHEEQDRMWIDNIALVMRNTRWVLDNLDNIWTFKVRWNDHARYNKHMTVGLPPPKITEYCDKVYNWIAIK